MNFSEALEEMRQGNRVTRERWKGIEMWIVIQKYLGDHVDPETSKIYQRITGKNGSDRYILWPAIHQDILAEDWKII